MVKSVMEEPLTCFQRLSLEIGDLVTRKDAAYGNSFGTAPKILALLYPDGVKVDQYADLLTVVRMLDKLKRVATAKADDPEDAWRDLAGYAILRLAQREADREARPKGARWATAEQCEAVANNCRP